MLVTNKKCFFSVTITARKQATFPANTPRRFPHGSRVPHLTGPVRDSRRVPAGCCPRGTDGSQAGWASRLGPVRVPATVHTPGPLRVPCGTRTGYPTWDPSASRAQKPAGTRRESRGIFCWPKFFPVFRNSNCRPTG